MLVHRIIYILFSEAPPPPRPVVRLLREMSAAATGGQPCHLFSMVHETPARIMNMDVTYTFPKWSYHESKLQKYKTLNWLTVSSFLHPCIFFRWVCKKMQSFEIVQYLIIFKLFCCQKWLPWWSGLTPSDDCTLQRLSRFVWLETQKVNTEYHKFQLIKTQFLRIYVSNCLD